MLLCCTVRWLPIPSATRPVGTGWPLRTYGRAHGRGIETALTFNGGVVGLAPRSKRAVCTRRCTRRCTRTNATSATASSRNDHFSSARGAVDCMQRCNSGHKATVVASTIEHAGCAHRRSSARSHPARAARRAAATRVEQTHACACESKRARCRARRQVRHGQQARARRANHEARRT